MKPYTSGLFQPFQAISSEITAAVCLPITSQIVPVQHRYQPGQNTDVKKPRATAAGQTSDEQNIANSWSIPDRSNRNESRLAIANHPFFFVVNQYHKAKSLYIARLDAAGVVTHFLLTSQTYYMKFMPATCDQHLLLLKRLLRLRHAIRKICSGWTNQSF